ncbi:MAG TPA: hypothetical protein V6D15_20460 [Oculatellaceae cyanobacterium]|jgi:hypothetical protein
MTIKIISENSVLAQAPAKKAQAPVKKTQTSQPPPASSNFPTGQVWLLTSGALLLLLIGLAVYGKRQVEQLNKKIQLADYKNKDIQKKLKLALETIRKMETNPDLVHSRDFNLDYLRMRMEEEVFNFGILNQLKIKVKQIISVALRPSEGSQAVIGIANTSGRQVDETFDVLYEMEQGNKRTQRVLFRIQVKLTKLPTQSTNATISEIVECIEKFLSLSQDDDNWQPTIQGRLAQMDWDQKAKPTPLLVLSQSSEGVNVSFRTKTNKRPLAK